MSRSIVQNSYTDEFKKNTVAVIRAGWPLKTTARRLGISVNTIRYWVSQDRFKDIQPASGETIKALSTEIAAVSNYQNPSLADFMYDNMMLEMNVIHSAWKNGCRKLEFLGSSCIYPRNAMQPMKYNSLTPQWENEKKSEVGFEICCSV
jgi:transposase-like protein